MGVRNCKEIGENLQKIVSRLMANDNLVNLLYYTDPDPLSQDHLTDTQKKKLIFEKLITVLPKITSNDESQSIIAMYVAQGTSNSGNDEFRSVSISISVFVPLTQWFIKDTNLRVFAILGEIQNSLNNKTINGLGKMTGGSFVYVRTTEDMCEYQTTYNLTTYD